MESRQVPDLGDLAQWFKLFDIGTLYIFKIEDPTQLLFTYILSALLEIKTIF